MSKSTTAFSSLLALLTGVVFSLLLKPLLGPLESNYILLLILFAFVGSIYLILQFIIQSRVPPPDETANPGPNSQHKDWMSGFLLLAAIGLVLGIMFHYIVAGDFRNALICFGVGVCGLILPLVARFLKTVKDEFLRRFEERLPQWAVLAVDWIWSKLEKFWYSCTSRFQRPYYQNLVYTYRTYRTQGLKTPGAFTPDLDKVFVPLRVTSKSPGQISAAMIQQQESAGNLRIWDFLAEIGNQPAYRRLVVIGAPGSGKTTLLEHLTLTYAQNHQRRRHPKAPKLIPVLLYLRQVRGEISREEPPNLAQLITARVKSAETSLKLNPPPQWFEEKLKQRKCLVMLDGLDEVADESQRQEVSRWVDRQMRAYPKATFILTSRPFGYRNAQLEEVRISLEVQPFNLKQMQQFIHSWYLQNEVLRQVRKEDPGVRADAERKANDLIERIKNNPPLAAMALNPLLLTMIATVHDNRGALPGSRVELYAEICDVLLARRQEAKGISDPIKLKASQKQSVLQVLALELMGRQTREFTLDAAKEIIQEQLASVASREAKPDVFLDIIKDVSGLLVERELGVYEFAHLSFQEYLAAVQVKETNQEQLLIEKISNTWWHETIRLYAAGSDVSNLIRATIKNTTVESLTLAYNCLEEGKSVDPEVRQQLVEMLESGLESTDPEIFKLAAKVRLSMRLNQLLRIDDRVEIDRSYMTCAEYQLFIDEMRAAGKNRQPDHWKTERFTSGDGKKPILGVRGSDAEEFCQWLTQQHTAPGVRYRLPTVAEAEEHPATDKQIGFWCKDADKLVIAIGLAQWQAWQQKLSEVLILNRNIELSVYTVYKDFNRDLNCVFRWAIYGDINLDINRVLNRVLNRDINLDINRDINLDINRDINLDINRVLNLDINRDLNFDLYRVLYANIYGNIYGNIYDEIYHVINRALDGVLNGVLNGDLNDVLNRVLNRNLNSVLNRDLNLDLYRDLNRVLHRDLNCVLNGDLYQKIEADQANDLLLLYFPVLFVIVIYHMLSVIYEQVHKDREELESINLDRRDCKAISLKYADKKDKVFPLYAYLVLLYERQQGRIPAWEGIRIVQERVE